MVNYSVSHNFGVTVFDNATGVIDPVRSWYAVGNELDRYGFTITESLSSPDNLVIAGYDRDENYIDATTGATIFANSNVFVYEFQKNTGNQVGPNYQFLVPHLEPSPDEFNFWNGQMPLIYYPDMSFTYRNATGTVYHYFHVGYRRNNQGDFTRAELFKTAADKRNECQDLIPNINKAAISTFIIQVSSGGVPVNEVTMSLADVGFNYVELKCDQTLGIGDLDLKEGSIYPNPATDVLFTTLDNPTQFTLFDLTGRTLKKGVVSGSRSISLYDIPAGMHLVVIEDAQGNTHTFKFIKK